jgi:hypothetical protein
MATLAAAVVLPGCAGALPTRGSGTVVDSVREVDSFDALAVDSAIAVSLAVGAEPSVVVRADDNVQDLLSVEVDAGTLTLSLDGPVTAATVEATVTAPADALERISLDAGSSLSDTEPLTTADLVVAVDGASRAFLVLAAGDVQVDADGAGVLNAAGTAAALAVRADGASSVQMSELTVAEATADARGGSRVHVTATDSLEATASGGSTISFGGDPTEVTQDAEPGSTIRAD